ncbi:DUF1679 domain-containing protein [Shewanella marinintestina]|uniref:DUF1679 domain-containing protein n=1 Tax=Shewanella marinintestina TaxID=190305 RepID=UPI00200E15B9|nr:DUF1679 domain-containing protein [Shewanella marinintestina]MCL1144433.1 DUF1679 domain-containing protein [Shewanella marinintestina]
MMVEQAIAAVLNRTDFNKVNRVQSLWSGYGEIARYEFVTSSKTGSSNYNSFIVKQISPPTIINHPKGWANSTSHQRKLNSYKVETEFYKVWAKLCDSRCKVANFIGDISFENAGVQSHLILMEDLDALGYSMRADALTLEQTRLTLRWLANFHAKFVSLNDQVKPCGLWPIGSYWFLATRYDEWLAMEPNKLKYSALFIDNILNNCKYKTLIHGDAKVANFCYTTNFSDVAAVDFQYVGYSCGVKDVIYLLGSCLDEESLSHNFTSLVNYYFRQFSQALAKNQPKVDAETIIAEWSSLIDFAWADFERFLAGWSPNHIKRNSFSHKITSRALAKL